MAELAYAADLKSAARKGLWVQVPPPAPRKEAEMTDNRTWKQKILCCFNIHKYNGYTTSFNRPAKICQCGTIRFGWWN